MAEGKQFTADEAKQIGGQIGIDWHDVDLDEFRKGLAVEMEHGSHDPQTDVTHDDPPLTGKIAWAHINRVPRLLVVCHSAFDALSCSVAGVGWGITRDRIEPLELDPGVRRS